MLYFFTLFKFLFQFISNLLIRYPLPKNLGYMWNYGFLCGVALVMQVITGLFLAMFYVPHVEYAFYSVDHIMHDVTYGWLLRLLHLNGASFFFVFIYIHMFRGLYYKSYHGARLSTWFTGITIYLLLMATAFLGYVLPWGQMSYWAATVITNFFTAIPIIGTDFLCWIWGGFSINNATLNRFFCLHYLLPFIIFVLVFFHLLMLHSTGSNGELKVKNCINANVKFYPFFIIKDLFTVCLFGILLVFMLFFYPEVLNHSLNYIPANPFVTPSQIVPEWYFLPFYAILRCIGHKTIGLLYMLFSIILLYFLPLLDTNNNRIIIHNSLHKEDFWFFFFNFVFLGYLGMQPINDISIIFSLLCTGLHFLFLLSPYLHTRLFF